MVNAGINEQEIHKKSQTEIPTALYIKLKIGIYKELNKKGLLNEKQLEALIKLQNIEVNFKMEKKL